MGKNIVRKVVVLELWLEEGARSSRIFDLQARFSTLAYRNACRPLKGTPLNVGALNGGICLCFSAKVGAKVDVKTLKIHDVCSR